jgi:HPt (histidine-containing phosphotransfer) domain-containing protein
VQTAPETSQPEPAMIQPDQEEKIHSPESLDSIAPIPFEFSTKAASDELGLPETLVQEFVSDFVQQAEENLDVFQEALQTGNIDTIQKTAHLLKGAASNLRIDPLAATLKELQYNESVEKAPDLFRQFVGQLKTLISFTKRAGN